MLGFLASPQRGQNLFKVQWLMQTQKCGFISFNAKVTVINQGQSYYRGLLSWIIVVDYCRRLSWLSY